MIGTSLSHYRINAQLGAGGMGEVYRASDQNLGRDVAIKVLPEEVAKDAERLARFKSEAQLLASLNHPNIAAIHGLEEADGQPFLVLELVEGEDLAERLKRGPIPVDEAIEIAQQIAYALEEAHEHGIVHRDLKPANVKLTPEGKVKVLDFGLAKAYAGEAAAGPGPDVSQSPTLAHRGTQAGVILGTAAYMSPEQARGKPVDKRADIWGFGVVLYEMLTGRQLFAGETVSDVLAAVLTREPEWTRLPRSAPASLERLLRRCLERDPRRRLHDIADARLELAEPTAVAGEGSLRASAARGPTWLTATALAGIAALAGAVVATGLRTPEAPAEPAQPLRFEIPLPQGTQLSGGIELSPDGQNLAFVARDAIGQTRIWVRSMGALEPRKIEATEGAQFPFWSPDSRKLGFFAGGALRIVDLIGETPRAVATAASSADVRGAAWSREGVIVYAPSYTGGLMQVAADGGEPRPATLLDVEHNEGTHRLPTFLPDGRHFVFYIATGTGTEPGWIGLGEIGSTAHRRLAPAHSRPAFLPPESLIYAAGKMLVAHRLDLRAGELTGEPLPLGVELPGSLVVSGSRALTASGRTLAYQVGVPGVTRLLWSDRAGRERGIVFDEPAWLFNPRLSPDGEKIAFSAYRGGNGVIWIVDPARNNRMRMTFDESDHQTVAWSPDGRELALSTQLADSASIELMESNLPSSQREWLKVTGLYGVESWLPGGEALLYTRLDAVNRTDIWIVERRRGAKPRPLLATPSGEHSPQVAPGGEWYAFVSDSSGRDEVYVARLSGGGDVWRVSSEGGQAPVWRKDGRELFYVDLANRLMAVPTTLGASFTAGDPEFLFAAGLEEAGGRQYDATPDGQRFLLNTSLATATNPIVVVRDWAGEIERRRAR